VDVEDAINAIESQIRSIKFEYEKFFKGDVRRAPHAERHRLHQAIIKLQSMHITNTQSKFKIKALANQFLTLTQYWDRIMAQVEAGTYAPDRFKADMRVGKMEEILKKQKTQAAGEKPAEAPADADPTLHKLYDDYITARRTTGESTAVSFDSFAASIEKQRPTLETKLGKKVAFKIVVEDGKAKVKSYST